MFYNGLKNKLLSEKTSRRGVDYIIAGMFDRVTALSENKNMHDLLKLGDWKRVGIISGGDYVLFDVDVNRYIRMEDTGSRYILDRELTYSNNAVGYMLQQNATYLVVMEDFEIFIKSNCCAIRENILSDSRLSVVSRRLL